MTKKREKKQKPKVAIVADWLTVFGGAEQVIERFTKIFPDAPIFTTVFVPENMGVLKNHKNVHTSFLQHFPRFLREKHPFLLPLLPKSIESLDVSEFDIVLSSSSFVGKGVITHPHQLHICYCHSPARYFWGTWKEYIRDFPLPRWIKYFFPRFFTAYRQWDFFAAKRPDIMIANSHFIQESIAKYYKRSSVVIPPPVDVNRFREGRREKKGDFYLYFGRLVPQKKVDLLIAAFRNMPEKKLIIAGTGRDMEKLKTIAKGAKNILFSGFVEDGDVPALLGSARALLFPQLEDAGITALEALAAGTPVIAYGKGGVLTTMTSKNNDISHHIENDNILPTGVFFREQTPESVRWAIQMFEKHEKIFNRKKLQEHARTFDISIFDERIHTFVAEEWEKFCEK